MHPQLIEDYAHEFRLWKDLLPSARYVGEIGLDAGPRFYKSLPKQTEIFTRVLVECARLGDKILSVHSVRSAGKVLDLLAEYLPAGRGTVILHWFTGTNAEMKRAIENGCYFSVNPAMLASDRGRKIVSMIPSDHILTETDGPFTKLAGKPSRPESIPTFVAALATAKDVSDKKMRSTLIDNLRVLTTAGQ
jgi:TatD DNase family protein